MEWSGMTREEVLSGSQSVYIFLICLHRLQAVRSLPLSTCFLITGKYLSTEIDAYEFGDLSDHCPRTPKGQEPDLIATRRRSHSRLPRDAHVEILFLFFFLAASLVTGSTCPDAATAVSGWAGSGLGRRIERRGVRPRLSPWKDHHPRGTGTSQRLLSIPPVKIEASVAISTDLGLSLAQPE